MSRRARRATPTGGSGDDSATRASRSQAAAMATTSAASAGATFWGAVPSARVTPAHTECSGSRLLSAGLSRPASLWAWLIAASRRLSVATLSGAVGRLSSPSGPLSARLAIYNDTVSGVAGIEDAPRERHHAWKSAQSDR